MLSPRSLPGSCTTILVTSGASADGRMRVAHSCDDALADHRVVFVPAKDWPEGAMRPVYPSAICEKALPQWNAQLIPRLYAPGREDRYRDSMGQAFPTLPVGEIPQVRHTYAYLDSNYGILNEKGLMFGECTCKARNLCDPEKGRRLFYSSELMRVALERCAGAREAVELMGGLINEYGIYGTGETLLVGDGVEGWVMEMAPAPEGTGGLWAAQRVPDGQVFVEANLFRIRELLPDSPDQILCPALEKAAREKPGLDWTAMISEGEYHHPYYSLRRVWRAFDILAPSKKFPPRVQGGYLTKDYPFAVEPDQPVDRETLFQIYRDHLEGTPFDLTQGPAAGPWGNPNHARPTDDEEKNVGAWERAISMVDTGYAYILEPGGLCWLSMGRPAEVPFVPLVVAEPPLPFSQGSPREFDPEGCAWWRFNLVSQYAELRYRDMIRHIAQFQQRSEGRAALELAALEESGAPLSERQARLNALAEMTLREWEQLFALLAVAYNQGYVNTGEKFSQREPSNPAFLKTAGFKPIEY